MSGKNIYLAESMINESGWTKIFTVYSTYRKYWKNIEPAPEEKIEQEVQNRLDEKLSEGKEQEGVLLEGSEVPR